MILAEKITKLRKQNGWSQEDLAMKLNVSRQSVSKWESTASMPDLDKIVKMSELFGVSTDYLLKDEAEEDVLAQEILNAGNEAAESDSGREVTLEQANLYLELVEKAAVKIAAGVAGILLAVAVLILLSGLADGNFLAVTEDTAGGIGVVLLLVVIAAAVAVFIAQGMKLDKYEFLEKEPLLLQYGIAGIVERKREQFDPIFRKCIITGVSLCILGVVPILIAGAFQMSDMVCVFCVVLLLVMIAAGVVLFIWSGMIHDSYQKLLEEGDYTREKKLMEKKNAPLAAIYWPAMTAVYLGVSFLTGRWDITWIIWPCSGLVFAAVCGIAAMVRGHK